MTRGSTDPLGPLVACVAIAVLIGSLYWRAFDTPFIFDDQESVLANPSIYALWPLWGGEGEHGPLNPPRDICTAGRPLVNLSLAVNYRLGGFATRGYHVFNVAVHTLSAILLWGIVRRTLRLEFFPPCYGEHADFLAVAAAMLWAVHPLTTEAVAYVTQRSELLVGFFYLATLYSSLRYWSAAATGTRPIWLALATLACLAGMASKEVMVSAPLVVLLYERTFLAGSFRRALVKSWPLYVVLAGGWLLLALLNYSGPRAGTAGFHLGVPAVVWWCTQAKVLLMYLRLVIWPWPLSIHYQIDYLDSLAVAWPWAAAALAIIVATLALVWRRTATGFVAAAALLILAPTLFVPILTEVAAERRMYLPLAGIVALFVGAACAIAIHLAHHRAVARPHSNFGAQPPDNAAGRIRLLPTFALLVAVMPLYAISLRRLDDFAEPLALWQQTVEHQPRSWVAHTNFGLELARIGQAASAQEQFRAALELKPDYAQARINLGRQLLDAGQFNEAIKEFAAAAHDRPDFPEAHYNLGVALQRANRIDEAQAQYEQALRLRPDYPDAHCNLGVILGAASEQNAAIAHYLEALRLRPDYFEACANLAVSYAAVDRRPDAVATAERALALAQAQHLQAQFEQLSSWLEAYRRQ